MKRLLFLLVVVTGLEFWAFKIHSNHPIQHPSVFDPLLLTIQLAMCWGGVEGARWLLRRSPIRNRTGPESEWTKLWLWVGPPGGVLFCLAILIGKIAYEMSTHRLAGPIVVAHLSGGAVIWLLCSLWTFPEVLADSQCKPIDKALAVTGMVTHLVGLALYGNLYPAETIKGPWMVLLASAVLFYFLLYYVWVSCLAWAVFFKAARKRG